MKRKNKPKAKKTPHFALSEVKCLVKDGRVHIRGNALRDARNDFQWDAKDIEAAILRLKTKDFYKRDVSSKNTYNVFDFYKAQDLMGESVYIHLYINDYNEPPNVVINSFKALR